MLMGSELIMNYTERQKWRCRDDNGIPHGIALASCVASLLRPHCLQFIQTIRDNDDAWRHTDTASTQPPLMKGWSNVTTEKYKGEMTMTMKAMVCNSLKMNILRLYHDDNVLEEDGLEPDETPDDPMLRTALDRWRNSDCSSLYHRCQGRNTDRCTRLWGCSLL